MALVTPWTATNLTASPHEAQANRQHHGCNTGGDCHEDRDTRRHTQTASVKHSNIQNQTRPDTYWFQDLARCRTSIAPGNDYILETFTTSWRTPSRQQRTTMMAWMKARITPTDARQGSPGRTSLRVLIGSMLMALVLATVLYTAFYYQSSGAAPAPEQQMPK